MSKQLLDFIKARLDEDEAKAQAAMPGPWRHNPDKHWRKPGTRIYEEAVLAGPAGQDAAYVAGTGESDDPQSMADAEHIARHDPTRVLAEVTAKRRIIELCERSESGDNGDSAATLLADQVLANLALPYADHPDYDESWHPDPS